MSWGKLYSATEIKIMSIGAIVGAWAGIAVGGFDQQITALISLVIADYVTGMLAAWKHQTISSRVGYKGVFKKVAIIGAVAFANCVDVAAGIHVLRSMVLFGFAGVEATSLLENVDKLGYGEYIPKFLRDKLIQIRTEKGAITL